jgi:hypothetical protein
MDALVGAWYWFAVTVFVTYGVTASALFAPLRVVLGVRSGVWVTTLFYCPVCAGTWISLATAPLFPHASLWWALILSPACFTTIVLLLKLYRDDFLVAPTYAAELQAIGAARGELPHE